jgi:phage I-like protein
METIQSTFSVEEAASGEFEVLRAGKYKRSGREDEVTEADLENADENFNKWTAAGAKVPVDYDHSFTLGDGSSKAAGWYASLKRIGQSLFASIKWTDSAKKAIADGEYQFFSPEFVGDHVNEHGEQEGFTMLSGALTNRPFLRGITQVSLSQQETAANAAPIVWQVEWTRDDTQLEMADTDTTSTESETTEDTDVVTMSTSEADGLKEKAKKADDLKEQLEALSGAVDSLKAELNAEKFSTAFSQAQREGRVDAKDETREKWEQRFETFGHEAAKELLFEMPAETIPVTETGATGEVSQSVAPEGVDEERFSIHEKAEALAKAEEIDYIDAVERVMQEA